MAIWLVKYKNGKTVKCVINQLRIYKSEIQLRQVIQFLKIFDPNYMDFHEVSPYFKIL